MGPDMEVLLRLLMDLRVLYYERSLARLHQKVPDLADADAALEPATWSAGGEDVLVLEELFRGPNLQRLQKSWSVKPSKLQHPSLQRFSLLQKSLTLSGALAYLSCVRLTTLCLAVCLTDN